MLCCNCCGIEWPWASTQQDSMKQISPFLLTPHPCPDCCLFQHRGGVCPSWGRRGHIQSEPGPAQEPEGAGGGGEDHTSQPRDETWDLVWSDHQLVGLSCREWWGVLGRPGRGGARDSGPVVGTENLHSVLKFFYSKHSLRTQLSVHNYSVVASVDSLFSLMAATLIDVYLKLTLYSLLRKCAVFIFKSDFHCCFDFCQICEWG